ncbi:c-type cytochrome [Sinomicrobium weinanense]|uniref:Cytochrome c n=1 Tax=Sinomicrobium weinanense TaxID=2842200 RepID=A0A926JUQ6_9FLAO|nr:cytochrome c [Sinomicrobium weinanense]MBC9797541.1 cytochrome c [Sinomicrobium weinanense]MBU3123896.1 cytochrome c [Sinomicrobium weinanense]
MRSFIKIGMVLGTAAVMTSCFNKSKPNYQFMPNMYEEVGYKTYQESDAFKNGVEAQLPAENTINRGWMPYDYEDTQEGKALATVELKNPLTADSLAVEDNLAKGKELYGIYCAVCHGDKGDGQGILAQREKFLGIPSYADRETTEGSIYHVIYYGLNSMGSYAVQLDEKERWQVVMYVEQLKKDLGVGANNSEEKTEE